MGSTVVRKKKYDEEEAQKKKQVKNPLIWFPPWRSFSFACVLLLLTIYYLTQAAPTMIPVPAGTSVPFPAATDLLEDVVYWCGKNSEDVLMIGLALLVPGLLRRWREGGYYIVLSTVLFLGLGFTYLSISAPVDRLLRSVEEKLPEDRRIPGVNNTRRK